MRLVIAGPRRQSRQNAGAHRRHRWFLLTGMLATILGGAAAFARLVGQVTRRHVEVARQEEGDQPASPPLGERSEAVEPTEVATPIVGHWMALNSPADQVPSHGTHAYGQAYAIDLVHEPAEGGRPPFGWWPVARRPEKFPAFEQPIMAASDGVIVSAHDRDRDHWSRNSWPALPFILVIEPVVRVLAGPGRILGNQLIVDCGDGTYAAYAHLQRDSLQVKQGDRVEAGQHIANCGNSGNSSEPDLHFQVMDHPNVLVAAGLPFSFTHFEADDTLQSGVPTANHPFVATPAAREVSGRCQPRHP